MGSMGVSQRRTGNPTGFTRVRYIIFIIFIHLCVRDKSSAAYTAAIAVKRFYLPFFRYKHTHTHTHDIRLYLYGYDIIIIPSRRRVYWHTVCNKLNLLQANTLE